MLVNLLTPLIQTHFMNNLPSKKIVVVTHSLVYSASQALRDFLREHACGDLLYISHPLPNIEKGGLERSYCEISRGKKIRFSQKSFFRFNFLPLTIFYEFCLTLFWVVKEQKTYDLFIGVDNINALCGLLLKKIGRTKKVVYYTIDYFPTRFSNKQLNSLYHAIDKLCVKYSDETWNVSEKMIYAREKTNSMQFSQYPRQYTVPIGIWYKKVERLPFNKVKMNKIVFVGHLVAHMGVDLIIKSIPLIQEKIPTLSVDIIGGGEELDNLNRLAKKMKVASCVHFWGWVKDRTKLETIMKSSSIGLAPFNTTILDEKVKNADPGKIKDYMLLGMPVVMTNAVSASEELRKNKCAYIISYTKKSFSNAIIALLLDKKLLQEYRKNVLKYIKQFDYETIYKKNLARVLKYE